MYSAYFFVFSIFVSLSWGYKDCGSKAGSIQSVSVSNCEEDQKCVLKKKTNVTIEVVFTSVGGLVECAASFITRVRLASPIGSAAGGSGNLCNVAKLAAHPKFVWVFNANYDDVDSKTVTPEVHGIIGPASIPFPVPNPDGCKDSGITCPVSADQTYKYIASFYVEPSYPSIGATVKLELKDDKGKDFFCKMIPGKIK